MNLQVLAQKQSVLLHFLILLLFLKFQKYNISILNLNTANKNSFLGAVIIAGTLEKGVPGEGTVSLVAIMLQ